MTKKCQFCDEEIQQDAVICKHCSQYVGGEISHSDYKLGKYLEKNQYIIIFGWLIAVFSGLLNPFLIIVGAVIMLYLANKLDAYRKAIGKK